MKIKAFYKCPVCGEEYTDEKDAIACANKPQRKHKYKVGSVLSIKTNKYCSPYTAIIIETAGHEGHEPKYIVDPRNGLCTYDIVESQIVEVVFGSEEYKDKEKRFELYKESLKALTKEYFGDSVKIDDYSMLLWDKDEVAKIKFYIENEK